MNTLDLARSLVDIDSTTGREGEACRWREKYLPLTCPPSSEEARYTEVAAPPSRGNR